MSLKNSKKTEKNVLMGIRHRWHKNFSLFMCFQSNKDCNFQQFQTIFVLKQTLRVHIKKQFSEDNPIIYKILKMYKKQIQENIKIPDQPLLIIEAQLSCFTMDQPLYAEVTSTPLLNIGQGSISSSSNNSLSGVSSANHKKQKNKQKQIHDPNISPASIITLIDSSNVLYKFKYLHTNDCSQIQYSGTTIDQIQKKSLQQLQVQAKIKLAFKIKKCTTLYITPSQLNGRTKEYTIVLGESEKGKLKIWTKQKQIVELTKIIDYVKASSDTIYVLKEEQALGLGRTSFTTWKLVLLSQQTSNQEESLLYRLQELSYIPHNSAKGQKTNIIIPSDFYDFSDQNSDHAKRNAKILSNGCIIYQNILINYTQNEAIELLRLVSGSQQDQNDDKASLSKYCQKRPHQQSDGYLVMHDMMRGQENHMMHKYLYSFANRLYLLEIGKGVKAIMINSCTTKDQGNDINPNIKILSAKFIDKQAIFTIAEETKIAGPRTATVVVGGNIQTQQKKMQKQITFLLHTRDLVLWNSYNPFNHNAMSEPFFVHSDFISQKKQPKLYLLDLSTHNIAMVNPVLNKFPYILSPAYLSSQQKQSHQNLINNLAHRVKNLEVMKSYLKSQSGKSDIPAAFRGLGNCENYSVLNDGLTMLNNINGWKLCGYKFAPHYVSLLIKLFDSKMESHVENSLTLLVNFAKAISTGGFCSSQVGQNEKIGERQWKQCMAILKNVGESKRMKKLTQQQKKRKLFELSYEFTHLVNSRHIM